MSEIVSLERSIIKVNGSPIELSRCMVEKLKKAEKCLARMLERTEYRTISGWLNSPDFAGCRNFTFQMELSNWGIECLASEEGIAWLMQRYP